MSSAGLTCSCMPSASLVKALILLNPPWIILGEHKAAEALRSSSCLAARAVTVHGAVPQVGRLLGDLPCLSPPQEKGFLQCFECGGGLEVLLCQASNGAGGWLMCLTALLQEPVNETRVVWQNGQNMAEPGRGLPPLWVCQVSCVSACLANLLLPFGAQANVCGAYRVGSK